MTHTELSVTFSIAEANALVHAAGAIPPEQRSDALTDAVARIVFASIDRPQIGAQLAGLALPACSGALVTTIIAVIAFAIRC